MILDIYGSQMDNNYINESNSGRVHESGYGEKLWYAYSIRITRYELIFSIFPLKKKTAVDKGGHCSHFATAGLE